MRVRYSTKHTISVAIAFLLLFSIIPSQVAHASTVGKLLNANFYFHRELSGIGDYRILNTAYPTYSDNKSIVQAVPIGVWEVGDGWITPAVPRDITLQRAYNFLFSVWGAGSGNATLFFKFYAYRNDNEHFLFTSKPSEQLILNATEMLWQHKTKEVTLQIEEGDRLVLRLFINVTVMGRFGLGYDCTQYPSYVNDPTETRYFRDDQQTVNGLTAYKLLTSQSSTGTSRQIATGYTTDTIYIGIRVWYRNSSGTETEITSGSAVAVASKSGTDTGTTTVSATWACPATALASADAIVVRVYANRYINPPTTLMETFTTEQLGAQSLDSATWTVYYPIDITYNSGTGKYTAKWRFGSSIYNSRIEGFTWTAEPSGAWHDVSSWTASWVTKTWASGTSWSLNLPTMQWLSISTWDFSLLTRKWVIPAEQWLFDFGTRIWVDVVTRIFNLPTSIWNIASTWLFYLSPPEWVNVAVWMFHLVPAEWIFPFIWIIMAGFIGLCCLVLVAKPKKKRETENV